MVGEVFQEEHLPPPLRHNQPLSCCLSQHVLTRPQPWNRLELLLANPASAPRIASAAPTAGRLPFSMAPMGNGCGNGGEVAEARRGSESAQARPQPHT